jgi:hypothetical protein
MDKEEKQATKFNFNDKIKLGRMHVSHVEYVSKSNKYATSGREMSD